MGRSEAEKEPKTKAWDVDTGEEDVAVCKGHLTVHGNVGCAVITRKTVTN